MGQEMKCKLVNWSEVYKMCKGLAREIEKSGYRPDTIIALARSGFVPGRLLSDLMGITDLVSLKVEHWLDTTGTHKKEATIPYNVPFRIKGHRVLVVDDIVDTGKSMAVSVDYIKGFKPGALKVAVMQHITASQYVPDYYAMTVSEWAWFIYPWNLREDLCNLIVRVLKTHPKPPKNIKEIREKFKKLYGLRISLKLLDEVVSTLRIRGRIKIKGEVCTVV